MEAVHISPFQGVWYPDRDSELRQLLEERFAESCRRTGPWLIQDPLGLVAPHAGPEYSGTVASAVYRALQRARPERIVVLAFPHRGGLRGGAIPDVASIATPLGMVAIDTSFAGAFPRVAESRLCDHSFEIQLPFLQVAAPQARVAPLYVGRMDADERAHAAEVLAGEWRPGTIFLASSDFTHYGRDFSHVPFPPGDAPQQLHDLDFEYLDAAGSLDARLFLETLGQHHATVCGADPIALLLATLEKLAPGDVYQSLLDYQTSGEINGDFHHSVSYAAVGYSRRQSFQLSPDDGAALLEAAALTLRRLRRGGSRDPVSARGSLALEARGGMFVSLHQGNELLGCIGNIQAREALAVQVGALTLAAALDDPRFRPAANASGPIDLEISVLTPLRRLRGSAGFAAGRHGALFHLGAHSALLLPQVAEEHGLTAEKFLDALARKSLLGSGAWRDPKARLSVFEAQVFHAAEAG